MMKNESRKMCEEYIAYEKKDSEGEAIRIRDYHSFMIAHSKLKPKGYPADMKEIIITKWCNKQYYLVEMEGRKSPVWRNKKEIKNKK